jgi:urea carboxylase
VTEGDTIGIIEAMKMESPVISPVTGTIRRIYVQERQPLSPGGAMLAVEVA